MLVLRDYQAHAVNLLRQAFSQGHKRVILQLATGGGKSEIAAQIIMNALSRYKRVVFAVNKIVLAEQISERFDKYGLEHGIHQAQNERYHPELPLQIASVQTLKRRKTLKNIDICIYDECHVHAACMENLAECNPDALFIGLTASPYGKLAPWWQKLVVAVPMKYLMDTGHLCKYEAYAAPCADLTTVKTVAGEYNQKQLAEVTDKPKLTADVVSTYQKIGEGRQAIIFSVNRAHAKHIAREFNRRGISAESIDCYTDAEDRKQMINNFNNCELRVLVSIQVIQTGFDSPVASYAALACATKSKIKLCQSLGRVLRTYRGKTKAIVADHGGNMMRLGYPEDWIDAGLDDGKRKKKQETRETIEKLPKACPSCTFIKPAGIRKCPACGLIPEVIKDVDFEAGELVRIQKRDRKDLSTAGKQAFLDGLNSHAKEKGYKKGRGCWGWSLMQYEKKFGCSPSSRMDWGSIGEKNEMVRGWLTHMAIAHAANVAKMRKDD